MEKEIYKISYVKNFLQDVVHPAWLKQKKLRPHRPISYSIARIKDEKKRSYTFVLDFSNELIKHNLENEIIFKVTTKKFISKEYDFSDEWQEYQIQQEKVNNYLKLLSLLGFDENNQIKEPDLVGDFLKKESNVVCCECNNSFNKSLCLTYLLIGIFNLVPQ